MNVWRLRAFPKTKTGGNKAGVVVDASTLNEQEMQQIARDVGYSETAFVTIGDIADFNVRFFTPTSEVDLCGHATIATFNLLRDIKKITTGFYTQATKAGILQLDVRSDVVYMEQQKPVFYETLDPTELTDCFVKQNVIDSRYPVQVVSTGLKEIFVPIKSVEVLHQLTPNMRHITALSIKYGTIGMHLFALADEVDAYGRNFAPVVGIDEESATGTSNGALSCYLYKYVSPKEHYVLRQGYSMDAPSEIVATLHLKNGNIDRVWVGGTATIIEEEG
jgi:PhzF family phenazine biosynthesis protein